MSILTCTFSKYFRFRYLEFILFGKMESGDTFGAAKGIKQIAVIDQCSFHLQFHVTG